MAQVIRDQILGGFDWTTKSLQDVLEAIPADKYLYQPCPGGNHALWTMGHLATVHEYFLTKLAGRDRTLFDKYRETFFARSQPSPDAAKYPPLDTVREYLKSSRAAFRSWIESLSDEQLAAPLPQEFKDFASTLGGFLIRLVWHEGMHYGQLTVIRKSLGLAPVRI